MHVYLCMLLGAKMKIPKCFFNPRQAFDNISDHLIQTFTYISLLCSWASKAGGRGDTSPQSKYPGGRPLQKYTRKYKKVTIFNGSKLDPFKFHHNLSIVVAILRRTKPSHALVSPIKKHVLPLIRPERDR